MPQMSPLMWSALFSMTTLLLLASLIKLFFSCSLSGPASNPPSEKHPPADLNWMW